MSEMTDLAPAELVMDRRPVSPPPPRLLEDTELIGQVAGSGLRKPPYLVRRRDGQMVQLSQLLYVIAGHMDIAVPAAAGCAPPGP